MRCPMCETPEMVEISVRLQGRPVTMHACSACDARWWESDGDRLDLTEVLPMVKEIGRQRRPSTNISPLS